MNRRLFTHVLICLVVAVGPPGARTVAGPAFAMAAAGSVTGRVTDSGGQLLPGVSVTIVPERGGPVLRTTTDGGGVYQFAELPDGTYRVDLELTGFDMTRRNNVRVRAGERADADAVLFVSGICDCVRVSPRTPDRLVAGQVVDQDNRPLPRAGLEIVSPKGREVAYADGEGRFVVRVPVDETWSLTASAGGFGSVTRQISAASGELLVLTLRYTGARDRPDVERFKRPCC